LEAIEINGQKISINPENNAKKIDLMNESDDLL